jgi:hypothetical protein
MDVLQDFDFDSFLHQDGDVGDNFQFDNFAMVAKSGRNELFDLFRAKSANFPAFSSIPHGV